MILLEMAKKPLVISYLRFSRPEQMRGDSVRRQVEKSEAWAKERGLTLDTSLRDEGVSAFRGVNATEGKLSRFLELVRAGRIPKGSTLLVESLDRLSRNQMTEALELFLSVIGKGIRIVTLADGWEYTRESINQNLGNLMYSLMVLSRSHEESAMKSIRVADAWAKKRERARLTRELLTNRLPSWLQVNDSGKVALNPERAKIVREVYRLTAEGHGIIAIQKRLNAKYTGARAKHISRTHIHNNLTSRAVLGEFQPSKMAGVNTTALRLPLN